MRKIDYKLYTKPTDFLRFQDGETQIRIISSGGLVKKHGLRTSIGFVPLGECTETPECKHCLSGNEAKQKWIWIAYVRTTKEVKILDVGPMIGDTICKIAKEKGDPQEYDLMITKKGIGLKIKYEVKALDPTPFTENEIKATLAGKKFLIKKYFSHE